MKDFSSFIMHTYNTQKLFYYSAESETKIIETWGTNGSDTGSPVFPTEFSFEVLTILLHVNGPKPMNTKWLFSRSQRNL